MGVLAVWTFTCNHNIHVIKFDYGGTSVECNPLLPFPKKCQLISY